MDRSVEPGQGATAARVLVVDDHELSRKLLQRVLGRDGHSVEAVPTLAAGQAAAVASAPDVVILDLHLADGDGLDLVRRLRGDARTAGARIVACTAAAASADERRAFQAGCDAFIGKPIDTRAFGRLVAALASERERA